LKPQQFRRSVRATAEARPGNSSCSLSCSINPQESDAYFEIGVIYQQRKDLPRAMAAYKKAVEISPQDPDYRRALASISTGASATP
jgi:tetratricopeptide (TPR) repeat protein